MASKRRLRRKQCGNKRKFDSQNEAIDTYIGMKRRTGDTGRYLPYRCKFCGKFHFGHNYRNKLTDKIKYG